LRRFRRFKAERLLYRLSVSEYRERFVLKGGMLVTAWIDDDNRVTRDADFLGYGDANPDKLVADFRAIMQIEGDDGLVFDADALVATAIREEMEYGGVRLKTAAYLERTRISCRPPKAIGKEACPYRHRYWGRRPESATAAALPPPSIPANCR
jgi:Nucleotidyl transferase AbiEii toxin, Type IV TA system